MAVRIYDGGLLMQDGKIATSDDCCCCKGLCDDEHPCPPHCICCNGECVRKSKIPEGECCGPCDDEHPCPEGCYCCDGECQDEPCLEPELGACCECPFYTLVETNPGVFLVEQEAIDRADQVNAEVQAEVDLLEANGWECVGVEPAAVRYSPDNEAWEVLSAQVQGRCCGSLGDVIEGSPAGGSISPNNVCVQDENFVRDCVDGKTAEECADACGIHHPGEGCEDGPCQSCSSRPPCTHSNNIPGEWSPPIEQGGLDWCEVDEIDQPTGCLCGDPYEECGAPPIDAEIDSLLCETECSGSNPLP
jgi:hypothetical protein